MNYTYNSNNWVRKGFHQNLIRFDTDRTNRVGAFWRGFFISQTPPRYLTMGSKWRYYWNEALAKFKNKKRNVRLRTFYDGHNTITCRYVITVSRVQKSWIFLSHGHFRLRPTTNRETKNRRTDGLNRIETGPSPSARFSDKHVFRKEKIRKRAHVSEYPPPPRLTTVTKRVYKQIYTAHVWYPAQRSARTGVGHAFETGAPKSVFWGSTVYDLCVLKCTVTGLATLPVSIFFFYIYLCYVFARSLPV